MKSPVRILFIVVILFVFLVPLSTVRSADCDKTADIFTSSYDITFSFDTSGNADVNQKVSLTNLVDGCFASEYSLRINSNKLRSISGSDALGGLSINISNQQNFTLVNAKLNDEVIGKNKSVNFEINYKIDNLANKQSLIWSTLIPQLSSSEKITSFNLKLNVPSGWGDIFSLVPNASKIEKGQEVTTIFFEKNKALNNSILASFGDHQELSFKLKTRLENSEILRKVFILNLPPDTSKQQVVFKKITPKPNKIEVDKFGNYQAMFEVRSRGNVDVTIEGVVKIAGSNKFYPKKEVLVKNVLNDLKDASKYINPQDKTIQQKAKELKNTESIYDFVTGHLEYDKEAYEKGKSIRKGSSKLIQKKSLATNLEFVDLFASLSRAIGLPTRVVFGLVLNEENIFKPIFVGEPLNTKNIHPWVQVYDKKNKSWVNIDPTWGNIFSLGYNQFEPSDRIVLFFSQTGENIGGIRNYAISNENVKISELSKKSDYPPKVDLSINYDQPYIGFPAEIGIDLVNKTGHSIVDGKLNIKTENVDLIGAGQKDVPILFPFETKKIKIKIRSGNLMGGVVGKVIVKMSGKSGSDSVEASKEENIIVKSFFSFGRQQIMLFIIILLLMIGVVATKFNKNK